MQFITTMSSPSQVLVDAALKGTVLMLLALAAVRLLHRSSAAVRHRVLGLMFCGLLLLPALSYALPAWRVPVLPAPPRAIAEPMTTVAAAPEVELPPPAPVYEPTAVLSRFPDELLTERSESQPPVFAAPAAVAEAVITAGESEPIDVAVAAPSSASGEAARLTPIEALLPAWMAGAILILLPLGWSIVRNIVLRMRSVRVEDVEWRALLEELRGSIRLKRRVDLLESERPLVPMTWGLVRPVVLLPDQARRWTDRLRRFVLLHELAHVKRWDVGFQLLARAACAVYWFHPLAWYAMRRLRIERELACDDCVLTAGERPADYAEQLLAIARTCRPTGLMAAVAMAEGNSLEQRVRALLDRARSHVPLSRRGAVLLLATSMCIVTAVAVVRPAVKETASADEDSAVVEESPDPDAPEETPDTVGELNGDQGTVTVRGQVLLPDGAPAAGAIVRAAPPMFTMLEPIVGEDFEPPVSTATADNEGQFSVSLPSAPYGDLSALDERWRDTWKSTAIAASLPGYGPQWIHYSEIETPGAPIVLQLVEDVVIEGRVIDLEGQPVAGVPVQVGGPNASQDEDLSAWIEAAKSGEVPWRLHMHTPRSIEPKLIGVPERVTSDDQGRFTISGMGVERHLSLVFESETVAHRQVSVATRRMEPFQRLISPAPFEGHETVYGVEFTFTGAPSRPIEGIVRDAETGEPMPGVSVESYKLSDYPYANHRVVKAVTDEQGRYRLFGMPKGDGNQLLVLPNDEQPYLMRRVDVPNPAGLGPATVDIDIHRGLWISGRITDKVTGEPVGGARVYYMPFRSNEFAQALPEFDDDGNVDGDQLRYQSNADGTYRLVGLPGRAIVGATSVYRQYRDGVGYDAIDGPYYLDSDNLDTYRNPVWASPKWPNVMAEINPAADAESVPLDLQMDPGLSVPIRLVGPDDEPLRGVVVTGFTSSNNEQRIEGDRFEATEFAPDETRTFLFRLADRDLGRVARIAPGDAEAGPVTVSLQPVGSVTARLLDKDGFPISGLVIRSFPLPSGDFAKQLPTVTTDRDGRFQLTLLPGAAYSLHAEGAGVDLIGEITRMLTIEPGEEKDLGDLSLNDRQFESLATGSAEGPDSILNLRGHVLDPDGQPHQRASVWVREPFTTDWTRIDRTVNGGRFSAVLDRTRLNKSLALNPQATVRIAATANGHGLAWRDVDAGMLDDEVTLNLLPDVAIEGRIVTLDGEPAAGVTVRMTEIPVEGTEDVDEFLRGASGPSGAYYNVSPRTLNRGAPGLGPVSTDADGRFRIEGLGADRVIRLEATGGGIGATRLAIVTRAAPSAAAENGAVAVRDGLGESVYYATFTHVAAPGRTLRGAVTDRETGDPIAGVQISTFASFASLENPVTTGADGRFEITGIPKQDEYRLHFAAMSSLHFNQELQISDSPGLEPIDVDTSLPRGIVVRGRVTDAETGQPLSGFVTYNPLFPNENVLTLGEPLWVANPAASAVIAKDGGYEIPVLPGPGAITAQVSGEGYISTLVTADQLREVIGNHVVEANEHGEVDFLHTAAGNQAQGAMSLTSCQAVALLNPPDDARELTIDLGAIPGRSRRGTVVDEMGRPLVGVGVIGLGPSRTTVTWRPLETAEFTVEGLTTGRERTLLFVHPQQQLGIRLVVTGDETTPLTVQLTPTGTLTGRFVDEFGDPLPDIVVELVPHSPAVVGTHFWDGKSGADGRFRVSGLIADTEYRLHAHPIQQSGPWLHVQNNIRVASGETLDLGAFTQANEYLYRRVDNDPDESAASSTTAPEAESQEPQTTSDASTPQRDGAPSAAANGSVDAGVTIRGVLSDASGKPQQGALVAAIGWKLGASRGGDLRSHGEVIAETTTDADGRYELAMPGVSSATHEYTKVLARSESSGLVWRSFDPDRDVTEASFELAPEQRIPVRLIDVEGRPAAAVRLSVNYLASLGQNSGRSDGVSLWDSGTLPDAWPADVTTDDEGRCVIRHVAADCGVHLRVEGDDRFARQDLAINTGLSEYRGEHDATYRPLVKNAGPGEEAALVLAPAQIMEGVIRYEDTGDPVPQAPVNVWASQQEFGSMISVDGQTDEEGRYRMHPYPGVRFGVMAYPPRGTPYLVRQVSRIPWPTGERLKQVDINLPRGVLVRGTVLEAGSGQPVVGATVQYIPRADNPHASDDIVTGWQGIQLSDQDGTFEIAVLPGAGTLLFHGARGQYVLQEIASRQIRYGRPGGDRYYAHAVHELDLKAGAQPLELTVELQRGERVSGRLVDESGAPIERALMITRLDIAATTLWWRGFEHEVTGGQFERVDLAPGREYDVYFLDPERQLGAAATLRSDAPDPTIVLRPCGQATARYVNGSGEPLEGIRPGFEIVVTPGPSRLDLDAAQHGQLIADADFVANVDRKNHWNVETDEDGRITYPALIPGATYRINKYVDGRRVTSDFTVDPGEHVDLGEIVIDE